MGNILYLETATKNCSVAIGKGTELLCLCEEQDEGYAHAEKLHTFIEWALEGAALRINELDAVCVSMGPGSYTGLRIGVSSAKGLCFGLGIPLIALNSLDVLAQAAYQNGEYDLILPMIDARRNEVFTKAIKNNLTEKMPTKAMVLDGHSFTKFRDKNVAIIGNGAEKAKSLLNWQEANYLTDFRSSASDMLPLGNHKFIEKDFEDVAYFEPFYLKEFLIQKKNEKLGA